MTAIPICARCHAPLGEEERLVCRRCKSDPFPDDTLIRTAGFRIWIRPRQGKPIWWRRGRYYTHAKALMIAKDKVVP